VQPIPDNVQLPPKWILEEVEAPASSSSTSLPKNSFEVDSRPIPDALTATLTKNKRVTPDNHWQDVRHICLTTPETVSYSPGDMISITPKNFSIDVDILLELMDWKEVADKPVSFAPGIGLRNKALDELPPAPIPYLTSSSQTASPPLTLRILLTDYLDIRAIPRRSFFANVAHYSNDEMHKERLLEFTNPDPEFVDDLWDYTTRPRRSILEVLQEFDSVKIPWQHAASVLPVLRGRQFSIASGGELKKIVPGQREGTKFELLVAIVKYRTVIKKIRQGVCTRYLSALQPGSTLKVHLQRGGLNPTLEQLTGPSVLVGPGTGLAPLRAMIWEKAAILKASREEAAAEEEEEEEEESSTSSPNIGPTLLLFGGRNRAADFFFEDEWKRFEEEGLVNLEFLTAFSRDQKEKVYVQDRIRQNADKFLRLLYHQAGSVFICGSSGRMPETVREALVDCFEQACSSDADGSARQQAEQYLVNMEKIGRYKQETW
jgi:sulfite reductase alpha subunit-like flavoprotein